MALVPCAGCGKNVSSLAAACPHCGRPREDAVQEQPPNPHSRRRKAGWAAAISIPIVALLIVRGWNENMVNRPVQKVVGEDSRNKCLAISAHLGSYVDWNTLVLDLRKVENAAPMDLFRLCRIVSRQVVQGHCEPASIRSSDGPENKGGLVCGLTSSRASHGEKPR